MNQGTENKKKGKKKQQKNGHAYLPPIHDRNEAKHQPRNQQIRFLYSFVSFLFLFCLDLRRSKSETIYDHPLQDFQVLCFPDNSNAWNYPRLVSVCAGSWHDCCIARLCIPVFEQSFTDLPTSCISATTFLTAKSTVRKSP